MCSSIFLLKASEGFGCAEGALGLLAGDEVEDLVHVGALGLHLGGIDEGEVVDQPPPPLEILEIALFSFGEVPDLLLAPFAGLGLDPLPLLEFGPEGDDGLEC